MNRVVRIPYGHSFVEWMPAPDLDVQIINAPEPPNLEDPVAGIETQLDHPLQSQRIEELARGAGTATIVVTDSTRPCPDHILVPAIVERLVRGGIGRDDITILVAIGMHRPSTLDEKIEKLGREIVEHFRVFDSAPLDPTNQRDLGTSPQGTPVRLDRRAVEAGLLVATGIVEPHQYAGFSGGWKTVGIGVAGPETISDLHGMKFVEHPLVRLASTEKNPFLDAMRWIGERAGLRFVVNVALDSGHRITAIRAGNPQAVHEELSAWVGERATVPVKRRFLIVIAGAGHPKDSNLYQASRIPTYLCFGRSPAVEPGGVILVQAACPEGAGSGPGEQRFHELLSSCRGPDDLLNRARKEGYPAGGQRAVMVALAQQQADIAFVGCRYPGVAEACGFHSFPDLTAAVTWARTKTGENRILVVPQALTTIPEFQPCP